MSHIAAIAAAVKTRAYLDQRAADARAGRDGHWRNHDVREAMVQVIDRIVVTAVDDRTVEAVNPDTHNGRIWHYFAREALTKAAPDGYITSIDHGYRLTLDGDPR